MNKKWVIQVQQGDYLLCGNAKTGFKTGDFKSAYHFRNEHFANVVSAEMKKEGYCCMVYPAKEDGLKPFQRKRGLQYETI